MHILEEAAQPTWPGGSMRTRGRDRALNMPLKTTPLGVYILQLGPTFQPVQLWMHRMIKLLTWSESSHLWIVPAAGGQDSITWSSWFLYLREKEVCSSVKSFGQNCWSVCSLTLLLAARPHRWLSQELPPLALGPGLWGIFWNGSSFKLMFLLLWQNTRQKQLKEANAYVDLQFGKGHSLLLKASHGYGCMANCLHSVCSVKTEINVGTHLSSS